MRFVPLNCLRPGQLLASDLSIDANRIMLRNGVSLTSSLISRIRSLGFQGVYIHDDISKDLEVASIISDQLKGSIKRELRYLYTCAEFRWDKKANSHLGDLSSVVTDMVDEILNNKHLLVNIVDIRTYDDYTFSHSINVAVISVIIGQTLGLKRNDLQDLAMGAVVHDIGKVFIDKEIINKPAKLTDDEYLTVKKHSYLGYDYLQENPNVSKKAKLTVLNHHEQYNGNGYPAGLHGDKISLFGRIVCVADVYDALTSDRPYRPALAPSDAFEYIMGHSNTIFEPRIVEAFTRKVVPYPTGTCVRLSNDDIAIVVANFESSCLRPKVRLLHDRILTDEYIDLTHDHGALNITIKGVVNI